MDLYNILEVERDATDAEIRKSYRRLALKLHPDKAGEKLKKESERKFRDVSEAYAILSDSSLRKQYDENGQTDLSKSQTDVEYNSKEVYDRFFQERKCFMKMGLFSDNVDFRSRKKPEEVKRPTQTQNVPLPCSLEEILTGVEKIVKVTRNRCTLSKYGQRQPEFVEESTILKVKVNPGVAYGKQVTFKGEGDQDKDQFPADIIFSISEQPHASFQLEGHDIVHTQDITLLDALTDFRVKIKTLGGQHLDIPFPEVIYPAYERRIQGEGLPRYENATERGDLIIRFSIRFPQKLSREQKRNLRAFLSLDNHRDASILCT